MAGKKDSKRALTEILRVAGDQLTYDQDGRPVTRSEQLAQLMWSMATEGRVQFPDSRELKASARDWKEVASWIYQQIDGPVKARVEVTDGLAAELAATPLDDLKALISKAVTEDKGQSQ